MDLSRQEYPALLASLQPEQAVNILSDRVELITKINSDIADWLHERRKIEEAYATSLRKLAQRPQQDGASALGIFQMPWQRIVSGTENLAQSHEMLAAKIESDVESPLRQFATRNKEMQNLNKSQSNLTSIAKEFGSAQKKAEKGRGSNARSKLDETSRDWDSQAPFVFEQLQALDETRVNHLRDVLTQFQTHEVDQVERNRLSAESCLNALLNIETADEIKTFAARVAGGRGSLLRRPSSAAASTIRPMSSSLGPPPTPPPRGTQGRSSQQSGSDVGQDRLSPLPDKTPHKSSLGGLKRLGTVISRRKSTAPPPPPSSSEKRKEKGRSFAPFRRGDSSRSFQDLEESGRDLAPVSSSQNDGGVYRLPSHEPPSSEPPRDTLTSPSTTVNGTNLYRTDELPESLQPPTTSIYSTQPQTSSIYSTPASQYQAPPPQELSAAPSSPEYVSPPSDAISRAQQEATMTPSETDESARNLTIRDQPIPEDESEAQKALSNIQNQLRMQAQSSGLNRVQGSVRGRRDVRNTIFVPSAPNLEAPPAEPSATKEMIPALGLATGAVAAGGAAAATAVGMNDIASPIKRSETSNTLLEESHPRMGSDANSVHSAQSLAGMVQHPELTKPGLNTSIIETVNTWFAEGGAVSRSFVVGEVAMAYNATGMQSEKSEETIRLENFQVLEKVAANPTFVTATTPMNGKQREGEETAGEYSINTSAIRRPSPTVALKYQLHIDPENQGAFSPLLLSPAWQIQESQVSVIVVYGLNPAFAGPEGGVTLKNVVVSVNLDVSEAGAGRATNAMMRPTEGAAFRRKQSAVVWRLGEVRLEAMTTQEGGEEKKLLVRFMTQGGMPKRGSVDVKFEVVGGLIGSSALGVKRMIEASAALESDPFADDMEGSGTLSMRRGVEWEDVPMKRKLVAGRYCAA